MNHRTINRPRSTGFVAADALMGMAILGVLMVMLAIGLTSHMRAATDLADTRAACNAAESALIDLQQGIPPAASPSAQIQIERLPGGTAIPDFAWVRVTATVAKHHASLTGLAKESGLKGAE